MMMLRGFAAIACACACSAIARASSDVNEALAAKGLIGDHFGVPGLNASFDYVIVGGGTAGLALARRLASNASNSVAVVDAGDFYEFANGNYTEIPADASMFVGSNPVEKNPFLDWYQYTTRQQVRLHGDWLASQALTMTDLPYRVLPIGVCCFPQAKS